MIMSSHRSTTATIMQSPQPQPSTTRSLLQFQQLFAQKANTYTKELQGHRKAVRCLVWSPAGSGNKLATGSDDCTVRIYTLTPSGPTVNDMELSGHTDRIYQLAFNPSAATSTANRLQLATASSDKTIRIWDCRQKRCAHTIKTEGENINLCWKRDGSHIVVGSHIGNKQDIISVIDVRRNRVVAKVPFRPEVNEVKWDHSGQLLLMCTGNGTIEVNRYMPEVLEAANSNDNNNNKNSNDTSSGGSSGSAQEPSSSIIPWKLSRTISAHTSGIYCIDIDPTGKYFAVGAADAMVSLWSLPEMICVNTIGRMEMPIRTVSFSHDGQLIAHGSEEKTIDVSHVETGERVYEYSVGTGIHALSWHPEEYLLACARDKDHAPDIRVVGIKPNRW